MKNYQNIQKNSRKDITWLLEDAYQHALLKVKSDEQERLLNHLAIVLKGLLNDYVSLIKKYELLTLVHGRKTRENLKKVSKDIRVTLRTLTGETSQLQKLGSNEIQKIENQSRIHAQKLQGINEKLSSELLTLKKSWNDKISRMKQIIKIPDLSRELKDKEDLLLCIRGIMDYFEDILDVQDKDLESLQKQWKKLEKKFCEFKNIESYAGIKKRYKFSDETVIFLEKLLNGEEIPLSSISPKMLNEIKKFADLCSDVKMRFQPKEINTDEI